MGKQVAQKELFDQVELLMQRGRYVDAVALLRRRANETKNDWRLIWDWGWCYFKLDNFQAAKVHLRRATQLAPDNPVCHWAFGMVCQKAGNYRTAGKSLRKALSLKDSYIGRLCLAVTYMEVGKLEEAEQVHLQGIALKPDAAKRYKAYADFLFDVGRKKEERQVRQTAREIARKQKQVSK